VPVHVRKAWRSERAVSRPAPREGSLVTVLSVVVLDEPPQRFHDARLRVAEVDRPAGVARRRVGIRRAAEPAPVLHPPGPIALIRGAL
jgi:hypothetical protein